MKKSWNLVISHGILTILLLNFTKFVPYLPTLRNLASVQKVCTSRPFQQNLSREMVIENRETVVEKSSEFFFSKSVETLSYYTRLNEEK